MEYWNIGIREWWNVGFRDPLLHHSTAPFFSTSRGKLATKARKANFQYTDHQNGKKDQQHAQGGDLRHPAIAPKLPDDGRDHEIFARAQRQGHGHFAIRQHADPDPAVEDTSGNQGQDNSTENSRRRSARYLPGFFQLTVDLNHNPVGCTGSVGDPANHVGDGDDRDGAVNGKNVSISQPEIAKAHGKQNARDRVGQKSDGVEGTAKTYLGSDHDPGNQYREEHSPRRNSQHQYRRIDKRQCVDEIEDRFVIIERDLRQGLSRRQLQIRQQRCPKQYQKWNKNFHRQVQHHKSQRGPLPTPECYLPRPVASPGYDGIFLALLDEPHIEIGQGQARH